MKKGFVLIFSLSLHKVYDQTESLNVDEQTLQAQADTNRKKILEQL